MQQQQQEEQEEEEEEEEGFVERTLLCARYMFAVEEGKEEEK